MKVKLGKLLDPRFIPAYLKLKAADLPLKKAFDLKSLGIAIDVERKKAFELAEDLHKKHAPKKEDGTPDIPALFNPDGSIKSPDFKKATDELDAVEIEFLSVPEITMQDLTESNVKFSGQDLDQLEVFFPHWFPKKEEPKKDEAEETAPKADETKKASRVRKAAG